MSKRVKWSVAGGVLLAIVAIGGLTAAKGGNKAVEVRTEQVQQRDLVASVTASGQVRPQTKVDLSSDITRQDRPALGEGRTDGHARASSCSRSIRSRHEAAVQRVRGRRSRRAARRWRRPRRT